MWGFVVGVWVGMFSWNLGGDVTGICVGLIVLLEPGWGCWMDSGLGLLAEMYVGVGCWNLGGVCGWDLC